METVLDFVCGTGGWRGPKPGDPDMNLVLRAVGVAGGIQITVSEPHLNAHAVAHIRLYRSSSSNYLTATHIVNFSGTSYYDKMENSSPVTYYYWIEVVSINGTIGEVIGPASATSIDYIDEILDSLKGNIDTSYLDSLLTSQIGRIEDLDTNISQEIQDRLLANQVLQNALNQVQTDIGQVATYMNQETIERVDGHNVLLSMINAIAAGVNGNAVAITNEQTIRINEFESVAEDITALFTNFGDAMSAIQSEALTRSTEDNAMTQRIDAAVSAIGDNASAIQTESNTRVNAINAATNLITTLESKVDQNYSGLQSSLSTVSTTANTAANNITQLTSKVNQNTANIQTESQTRVNAINSLASNISTVQSTLNQNISQVQQGLNTQIGRIDGHNTAINSITAEYFIKLNVNGLVGGFGLYNTGSSIQAGFSVNEFWVGSTQQNKRKPFKVVDNQTFIDNAVIRDGEITNAKIAQAAITTAKIDNLQVSTIKIANGAISATLVFSGYTYSFNLNEPAKVIFLIDPAAPGGSTHHSDYAMRLHIGGLNSGVIVNTTSRIVSTLEYHNVGGDMGSESRPRSLGIMGVGVRDLGQGTQYIQMTDQHNSYRTGTVVCLILKK